MKSAYKYLVVGIILLFLFASCAEKKESQKVYRVGILSGLEFIFPISDSFKAKMTELGYIEGDNIEYYIERTNFEPEKEKQIINKFITDKVDLIFTFPTEVSMEAKTLTEGTGIPLLFSFANIEGTGLVNSIREPGGLVTGVRYPGPDLAIRRFEVMLELAPSAKRIWIPYQRGYPIVQSQLDAISPIAASLGVSIIEFPADNAIEVKNELDRREGLIEIGFDAILFVAEPLSVTSDVYETLTKFTFDHKIPIGGAIMQSQKYGAIFGVNAEFGDTGEKSAILADKILRGTSAGTIPVISSEQFFELNPTAALQLGVNIPEGLLVKADRIIR